MGGERSGEVSLGRGVGGLGEVEGCFALSSSSACDRGEKGREEEEGGRREGGGGREEGRGGGGEGREEGIGKQGSIIRCRDQGN